MELNKKTIIFAVLAILLLEIFSFVSFLYPALEIWLFAAASILAIITVAARFEYGIALVFIELIISSFGRSMVLDIYGFDITARMMLWFAVLAIYVARCARYKRIAFFHSEFFKPYLALMAVLAWGIAFGFLRSNPAAGVFADANNYLYFFLIFPLYEVLGSKKTQAKRFIFQSVIVAAGYLSAKTIVLFYVFSHELFVLQDILYDWSRRAHLAEITNIDPAILTSRIFMQSHIWLVFALFVALACLLKNKKGAFAANIALITIMLSAIIMSFSRSFWLAIAVSFFVLIVLLIKAGHYGVKNILRFAAPVLAICFLSIGFTIAVAAFPVPKGSASAELLKNRAGKFSEEAAVSSRYSQIRPLFEAISKHPVLGSGFGTSVTYKSSDPRVLENNPDGKYTTTAFELGWLEIWLKIGLLGIGAYFYFFWKISECAWKKRKNLPVLGVLAGVFAVLATHCASPYLNHPLGIGIIMLSASFIDTNDIEL